MSYTLSPFAVDLEKLKALMGSKDTAVLRAVIRAEREEMIEIDAIGDDFEEFEDEIEADYKAFAAGDFARVDLNRRYPKRDEDDDEVAREVTTGEALAHLILGGKPDRSLGHKYGYALEILCGHVGTRLSNEFWSSIRYLSLESLDRVLKRARVSARSFAVAKFLVERGSPVPIPPPDDFPGIGYLTREEVPKVLALVDPATLEPAIAAEADDHDWFRAAFDELRGWLERCKKTKRDLICFYA